ncbi:phosphotransferase [Nocardia sp. NPDC051570]|uniref:phosphotransferase n=1 Tax=Nocardia sp. NPDC051570 TaxID=3364324 RepID=UPI00379E4563
MTMDPTSTLRTVLENACAQVGFDATDATPLRVGENAIYRLQDGVIARIARPGQQAAARREVEVARWLEASHVPAVRTIAGIDQPAIVDDRAVTFWHELPPHHHGSPSQVAHALRQLHNLPRPTSFDLGVVAPFVRLDQRIESALFLTDRDRVWMREHLDELRSRWDKLPDGLPWCVIHGDAWVGNVVAADDGTVLFLDLERTSFGPPEWDLVHTAIKHSSFAWITAEDYRSFCEVYGHDVTAWAGFELLRDIREFRMTCMAAQSATTNDADRDQALHRLACVQGRHGPRPWSGWRSLG